MSKIKNFLALKKMLSIVLISLIGCAGVVFSVLYFETFKIGFFTAHNQIVVSISVGIVSFLTVLAIAFIDKDKSFVHKLFFSSVILFFIIIFSLYLLRITGFLSRVDSVEKFREYIKGQGAFAVFVFILIQFLQVVLLPIPAFVTVGAGVLLFGAFKCAIYSCVGIIFGSIVAYFLGRIFGVKIVKWLVGEKNIQKGLNLIKGKDRLILTFMFLFPFFPDDLLCFVAGITTISPKFFVIMIFATRIISIFTSAFSISNSFIPYDTWWGILIWICFLLLTILFSVLICKYGEKIEKFITTKYFKKKIVND